MVRALSRGSTPHRCVSSSAVALSEPKASKSLIFNATLSAACAAGPLAIATSLFASFSNVVFNCVLREGVLCCRCEKWFSSLERLATGIRDCGDQASLTR